MKQKVLLKIKKKNRAKKSNHKSAESMQKEEVRNFLDYSLPIEMSSSLIAIRHHFRFGFAH